MKTYAPIFAVFCAIQLSATCPWASASDLQEATILRIIDGDTVVASINGATNHLRLTNIDAPELTQPHGPASRDYLAALLGRAAHRAARSDHPKVGRGVPPSRDQGRRMLAEGNCTAPDFRQSCPTSCARLAGDSSPYQPSASLTITIRSRGRDRYGRLLATLFAADSSINLTMVRTGQAWRYRYARKTGPIAEAEALARAEGRGVWATDGAVAPWEFRRGRGALSAETKRRDISYLRLSLSQTGGRHPQKGRGNQTKFSALCLGASISLSLFPFTTGAQLMNPSQKRSKSKSKSTSTGNSPSYSYSCSYSCSAPYKPNSEGTHDMNCCTVSIATLTLTLLLISYLTAARWLQHRSAWLTPHAEVDAVYILAGVPLLEERMAAAVDWMRQYDCRPATILIPEDPTAGTLPSHQGIHLPVSQWQHERLQELFSSRPPPKQQFWGTVHTHRQTGWQDIVVVPGQYHSTDGEMQALSTFLDGHPAYRRVALVTSRSHIRRAITRATTHIEAPHIIGVIPACPTISDYSTRRVAMEYLQLLRDRLGLTHAPMLYRAWWTHRGHQSPTQRSGR